ncbi:solute carrier family 49 member 4 homolog isoform X1 [Clavelina lepadiformis]|uniref:Uncharacterized protein n=1 Tax=Clavelina lepadiformis TaxID=159417 RepID=A0ABP0EW75_CLALP
MEEKTALISNKSYESQPSLHSVPISAKNFKTQDDDLTYFPKYSDDESEEIAPSTVYVRCQTYWYRWYICLIFSFMGWLQGCIWNTWSPIADSAKVAYGFTPFDIELLTNWGPIAFIVSMPIYMWILDQKGLRVACVSTALFVAIGAGIRCFPLHVNIIKYFIHFAHFLNGIGGCVVMAAPPLLSSTWFPPNERITATSISTLLNYMGTGTAYIIGDLVKSPSKDVVNASCFQHVLQNLTKNDTCYEVIQIRRDIQNVLYVEFGIAVVIFLAIFAYFPRHPPLPPSLSASVERMDFKAGLKNVSKNRQYNFIALVLALTLGTWGAWTGVMPLIVQPLNVSQDEAGEIGFIMTLVGCGVGMVVGWITDRLKGKMKIMLSILFSLALIMFLYLIIITNKWLKFTPFLPQKGEIWATNIILGIAVNAAIPLGMEMAADRAYPVSESISTSILVWLFNISSFFLLLALGYATDPTFANYILLGCFAFSVPVLFIFVKNENRRLHLDEMRKSVRSTSGSETYGSITGTSGGHTSSHDN